MCQESNEEVLTMFEGIDQLALVFVKTSKRYQKETGKELSFFDFIRGKY